MIELLATAIIFLNILSTTVITLNRLMKTFLIYDPVL